MCSATEINIEATTRRLMAPRPTAQRVWVPLMSYSAKNPPKNAYSKNDISKSGSYLQKTARIGTYVMRSASHQFAGNRSARLDRSCAGRS